MEYKQLVRKCYICLTASTYALLNSLRHKNEGTLKPTFCPELCTLVFFALYGTYFY